MHLPVATTQNRGLGINPSINRIKSAIVTEFQSGMLSISSRNGPKRDKIQSTPLQLILRKKLVQFSSDRERATTIV